jgi:hypothetical protein
MRQGTFGAAWLPACATQCNNTSSLIVGTKAGRLQRILENKKTRVLITAAFLPLLCSIIEFNPSIVKTIADVCEGKKSQFLKKHVFFRLLPLHKQPLAPTEIPVSSTGYQNGEQTGDSQGRIVERHGRQVG